LKIYYVIQIKFNYLVEENVHMIINLPTKRTEVTSEYETFQRILPTRWRRKPVGIDMERNSVTVTLCILSVFTNFVRVTIMDNGKCWGSNFRSRNTRRLTHEPCQARFFRASTHLSDYFTCLSRHQLLMLLLVSTRLCLAILCTTLRLASLSGKTLHPRS